MSKRKGSIRYDGTADKKYKLDSLRATSSSMSNGGQKILSSIGAPFSTAASGARLPDLNLAASATGTFTLDITQTVGTAGSTGGILSLSSAACWYAEETPSSDDTTIVFCTNGPYGTNVTGAAGRNGQIIPTSNVWEATKTTDTNTTLRNKLLPNFASLYGQASALRITGAGIQVEFTGNDTNNQGLITSVTTTASDQERLLSPIYTGMVADGGNQVIQSTQSFMENFRSSYSGALKNGLNVSWLPQDNADLEFGTTPNTSNSILAQANGVPCSCAPQTRLWGFGSTIGGLVPQQKDKDVHNYGNIAWHVSGGSISGSATVRVNIIVHVEYLPLYDSSVSGNEAEICKSVKSTMDLISSLASGDSTGSPAMTTRATELLGQCYEKAAEAGMVAQNDSQISTIGVLIDSFNMAQSETLLYTAFTQLNKLASTPEGRKYIYDTAMRAGEYAGKILMRGGVF